MSLRRRVTARLLWFNPSIRRLYRGEFWRVVVIAVTALFAGFAQASILVIVVQIAATLANDQGATTSKLGPVGQVSLSPGQMIVVGFAMTVLLLALDALNAYLSARTSQVVTQREQLDLTRTFMAARWSVQSEDKEGQLSLLVGNAAVQAGATALTGTLWIVGVGNFAALAAAALVVNAGATVSVILGVGAMLAAVQPLARLAKRLQAKSVSQYEELTSSLNQTVTLSREITTFGVRTEVSRGLEGIIDRLAALNFKRSFVSRLSPILFRDGALLLVLVAIAVVEFLEIGSFSSLAAVVLLLVRALSYGQAVQSAQHTIMETLPWVERSWERADEYRSQPEQSGGGQLEAIHHIQFRDVSFAYVPGVPVLSHVDFEVDKGEAIGVVGPSGAGKSTLIQLLLRLLGPDEGAVVVDGRPAEDYDLADWRRLIAFVPQEPRTFSGSIAENIRFFREGVTDDDIADAARRAHLDPDIALMPEAYQTAVGERGGKLSGGQRQRLAIARALVTKPEVIILDEPTSALDLQSEALIQETLAELHGTVTLFIVAHRLSTLNFCDRIMALGGGRIEAFASREELLDQSDFFRSATRLSRLP